MLGEVVEADSAASLAVSFTPGAWIDRLDQVVQAGHGLPLWVVLATATSAAGRSGRRAAVEGLVAAGAASAAANVLKPFFNRRRPWSLLHSPSRRTASFPSSHTATGAAFATAAAGVWGPSAILTVPIVGAVAFSRVHSRQHHLADVAAGAAVGVAVGTIVAVAFGGSHRSRADDDPSAMGLDASALR